MRHVIQSTYKGLLKAHGIIKNEHLKYTDFRIIQLLDKYMLSIEDEIKDLKKESNRLSTENAKLRSPELWTFGVKTEAPPDFKAEYLRRMGEKSKTACRVRMVRDND